MAKAKQRRHNYTVAFTFHDGTLTDVLDAEIDSVTEPSVTSPATVKQTHRGPIPINSRPVFSEIELMLNLEIVDSSGASSTPQLISDLESLYDLDMDTVNIQIIRKEMIGELVDTYITNCLDCVITSFKLDDVGRTEDSDVARVALTFQPRFVEKVSGSQMP